MVVRYFGKKVENATNPPKTMMSVGYVRLLNTATMMYRAWRVARRFPDYEPQPVTHASVMQWLRKFDVKDWHALLLLLDHVIYYSRKATADALVIARRRNAARAEW